MKTRNIFIGAGIGVIILIILWIIFAPKITSSSKNNQETEQEQQITTPQPSVTPPATAKDRFRDLKRQKRELVKELKKLKKDCQLNQKADALEAELEELQAAIDDFDCDEQQQATPAPAPAPIKRSRGVSTPRQEAPPILIPTPTPAVSTPIVSSTPQKITSYTTTGYEGGKIRLCIRLGGVDYCWLPQRLIMKGGTYQDVEDNGVGGNNWVFNAPGSNDIVSVTADGVFSIKASVVDEILQQYSLQPIVEIKTNILDPATGTASWRFQTMTLVGDEYVCNVKDGTK